MPAPDFYNTITGESLGEFKDRGSKFVAYAYPVKTVAEIESQLLHVRKLHMKARHHCYAWRLGTDKTQFRANDDGEPSGTAGKPILGQTDSFEVTNVLIVVVRYFGGTKLGTSGLINAYRSAAAAALEKASMVKKYVCDLYSLNFGYDIMPDVMNAIKKHNIEIVEQVFEHDAFLKIAIRQSEVEEKMQRMKAAIAKVNIEETEKYEEIEGLEIVFLGSEQ